MSHHGGLHPLFHKLLHSCSEVTPAVDQHLQDTLTRSHQRLQLLPRCKQATAALTALAHRHSSLSSSPLLSILSARGGGGWCPVRSLEVIWGTRKLSASSTSFCLHVLGRSTNWQVTARSPSNSVRHSFRSAKTGLASTTTVAFHRKQRVQITCQHSQTVSGWTTVWLTADFRCPSKWQHFHVHELKLAAS